MRNISDYERGVNDVYDTTVKAIFDSIEELYPKSVEEYVDYDTFMLQILERFKRVHEEME